MKATSLIFFILTGCSSYNQPKTPNEKLGRQFQQCYQESDSAFKKPPIEGKINYQLLVRGDGTVKEAKILESVFTHDRNFEACVTGQLKSYKFHPSIDGESYVQYQPLNFTAVQQ